MRVTVDGIDGVLDHLRRLPKDINQRLHLLMERLAEIGIQSASASFASAEYDGVNDVIVGSAPVWENDHTLVIKASGTTVLFIEFGTGITYPSDHPKAGELGMMRGTYGQGKGSRSAWGYYGEPGTNGRYVRSGELGDVYLTRGNPASRSMYEAGQEMRREIARIAEEVFRT